MSEQLDSLEQAVLLMNAEEPVLARTAEWLYLSTLARYRRDRSEPRGLFDYRIFFLRVAEGLRSFFPSSWAADAFDFDALKACIAEELAKVAPPFDLDYALATVESMAAPEVLGWILNEGSYPLPRLVVDFRHSNENAWLFGFRDSSEETAPAEPASCSQVVRFAEFDAPDVPATIVVIRHLSSQRESQE